MYTESRTITRKQIYDLVWRKPIRDVAPAIPRPPQGHWVRLQHGKTINQPELRSAEDGYGEVIRLPASKQLPVHASTNSSIPVSSNTKTHPLIAQCRKDFKGVDTNEYGRLVCPTRNDVDVSRKQLSRTLTLLNSVVHSLEEDGHTARWSGEKGRIEICVDEECISLGVNETSTRSEHVLSQKEQQDKKRYGSFWGQRWDYTPSGKLTLSLSGIGIYGVRSSWSDGKKETLESKSPGVLSGILSASERMKQKRAEDEQRQLRWAVRERRRKRLDKASKLFQQRVDAVDKMVADYQKATEIRA